MNGTSRIRASVCASSRFAGAGRPNQQDVRLRQFDVVVLALVLEPLVMIVDGNRQHLPINGYCEVASVQSLRRSSTARRPRACAKNGSPVHDREKSGPRGLGGGEVSRTRRRHRQRRHRDLCRGERGADRSRAVRRKRCGRKHAGRHSLHLVRDNGPGCLPAACGAARVPPGAFIVMLRSAAARRALLTAL